MGHVSTPTGFILDLRWPTFDEVSELVDLEGVRRRERVAHRCRIEACFDVDSPCTVLAAVDRQSGKLVAYTIFARSECKAIVLFRVTVRPKLRRLGIARSLVEELKRKAFAFSRPVLVRAPKEATDHRAWLEKCGFERIGYTRHRSRITLESSTFIRYAIHYQRSEPCK